MRVRILKTRACRRQIYVVLIIMKVELDRGKVLQCVCACLCVFDHDYCRVWFQQDKMTRFARNPYIMTSDNLYIDGR
jgi:hypothetical protein